MSCGQGTDVEVRSDGFTLVKPTEDIMAQRYYACGAPAGPAPPTVVYAQIAGLEDMDCEICYRKNSVCHSGICEEGHVFGDESQSDESESEEGESDDDDDGESAEEEEKEEDAGEAGNEPNEDDDAGIADVGA